MEIDANQKIVLEGRYLLKDENGNVIETPEDMCWRVASCVAAAEAHFGAEQKEVSSWAEKFFAMMDALDFLPNSPTLMNSGRPLRQLAACFVLPVEDNIEQIFDTLKYTAMIHKSGGGTGFDFSPLRPKGSPVRSTAGKASGPVSFMRVYNAATEEIKQGGVRRGANMGILRVDHPDIYEFIACKEEEGTFRNFNISVSVTDHFFNAIESGSKWPLMFNGRVYREVDARDLFYSIASHAHATGEPGMLFLDAINRANPTPALGEITATNPCVTGDTWVTTNEGPRQVRDLVCRQFEALVNGKPYKAGGFFKTGTKPIVKLRTREGYTVRLTADHQILRVVDKTRYCIDHKWVKVSDLKIGDQIILHNHRSLASWPGMLTEEEGYLLGLLVGDGVLKNDAAVLSVWTKQQVSNYLETQDGTFAVMQLAMKCAEALRHRSDFTGWFPVKRRNEFRLKLASVKALAERMGMYPGNKTITPEIERASKEGYCGFLRGLFDADGTILGDQKKGVSIRLPQSNLSLLYKVQRMLLRLGIASTIYEDRRTTTVKLMPDNKGGMKEYNIKAQHELVISKDNISIFAERIGFGNSDKVYKLKSLIGAYKRKINREHFVATVMSIENDGIEDVYDVQVPGVNAFDANGIYAHNCGEQPLLPYESCNLGSINLSHMLKGKHVDWKYLESVVKLAARFLDDVIEVNIFPLPQIATATRRTRKVGLGVMGWADMLFRLGIPYDSDAALSLAEEIMAFITQKAHETSVELARQRGTFPAWKRSIYHPDLPMRNAALTTIAPTGSISAIAGTTSGIEPVYALAFIRTVLESKKLLVVNKPFLQFLEAKIKPGVREKILTVVYQCGSVQDVVELKPEVRELFKNALEIAPDWHLKMQAAFQKHIDNAVSKTINLPADTTIEEVALIFKKAHELGLKGITIFRTGSRNDQPLASPYSCRSCRPS